MVGKYNQTGVYSPLTSQGNIIVDGVLASCYSDFDSHAIQHVAWAPFRWWDNALKSFTALKAQPGGNDVEKSNLDSGVHWYGQGLHLLAKSMLPWKLSDE